MRSLVFFVPFSTDPGYTLSSKTYFNIFFFPVHLYLAPLSFLNSEYCDRQKQHKAFSIYTLQYGEGEGCSCLRIYFMDGFCMLSLLESLCWISSAVCVPIQFNLLFCVCIYLLSWCFFTLVHQFSCFPVYSSLCHLCTELGHLSKANKTSIIGAKFKPPV